MEFPLAGSSGAPAWFPEVPSAAPVVECEDDGQVPLADSSTGSAGSAVRPRTRSPAPARRRAPASAAPVVAGSGAVLPKKCPEDRCQRCHNVDRGVAPSFAHSHGAGGRRCDAVRKRSACGLAASRGLIGGVRASSGSPAGSTAAVSGPSPCAGASSPSSSSSSSSSSSLGAN